MIYPVVVVLVDGIKCRALLDTGSGSPYASATLIENFNKKPVRTEHKQIEMMVCSTTQKINSYEATISSVDEKFTMTTVLSKVDKGVLLTIPNPRYEELLRKYSHLNESGSLKRLDSLVKKLGRDPELLEKYDKIIHEQLAEGIVERVVETPRDREFYIPHKPVIKETAKTTKVRIVFDASAKENERSPFLNDCMETGPALQNLLWNVLVRNRLKPIALSADLKQAFLHVVIRADDRDVLRFHWIKNKNPSDIEVLRSTRALFGLVQFPFLLAGTLKQHLNSLRKRYPADVAEIEKCLYVDDIISGGCTTDEVSSLKETTVSMFEAAKFQLHKWHSNESKLESSEEDSDLQGNNQPSYAKQQLGVRSDETKLLGLPWNRSNDTLAVGFPTKPAETTRREILRFLASIYDPLGIVSPVTLVGKMIFREACDRHLPWDEKLSDNLGQKWLKFLKNLLEQLQFQRSIPEYREPIDEIELHSFGDASGSGVSVAVYAVVKQRSGASVGLIAAKSRLAKKNLTIPRLELVSAYMAANLADNVRIALDSYPVKAVYGWLDSLVALY